MDRAQASQVRCAVYRRRRPERKLLYRVVQGHFETYLALAREGHFDAEGVPAYVEREFRRYLECGILAHGFARAFCDECQHDFLIAYSCKGRGVCPACNARRMVETAAHLADRAAGPAPGCTGANPAPPRSGRGAAPGFARPHRFAGNSAGVSAPATPTAAPAAAA